MNEQLDADELRRLMGVVRQRMSHEAFSVADGARQLTDWRFYVQRFTGPALTAASILGYLAVPRRLHVMSPTVDTLQQLAKKNRLVVDAKPAGAEKPGLIDTLVSMTGNVLLRAGIAYAGQHMGKLFGEQAAQTAEETRV